MKAVIIDKDKNLVWTEVGELSLKDGEVLVEIHASALNRADLMQRAGNYPPPAGSPEWPGLEIAGIIKEITPKVESQNKWKVGDKVCALLGGGGYAEYAAVDSSMLMPIPKNINMIEAAALPEAYATAYLNLFYEGKAKSGDTLLIHAGASGLASVIIPMAKAFGLKVITSVQNSEKAREITHLKADYVIDTSKENVEDVLMRLEKEGTPIDIAIDCLGSDMFGKSLPYVARGCRWIMIATLAGDISPINLRTVFMKGIKIIGSTLRSKPIEVKAEILDRLVKEIWQYVEDGTIRPTIYKTLPITDAEKAHELLESGKSAGKVVLIVK